MEHNKFCSAVTTVSRARNPWKVSKPLYSYWRRRLKPKMWFSYIQGVYIVICCFISCRSSTWIESLNTDILSNLNKIWLKHLYIHGIFRSKFFTLLNTLKLILGYTLYLIIEDHSNCKYHSCQYFSIAYVSFARYSKFLNL